MNLLMYGFVTLMSFLIADINCNNRWELPAEVLQEIGGTLRETGLNYLLRNDDRRCFLKLVCGVGARTTEYNVYTDQIAESFGPFDFSVVTNPIIIKTLQQTAKDSTGTEDEKQLRHSDAIYIRSVTSADNEVAWIKIEPSPIVKFARPQRVNVVERKPFVFKHVKPPSLITSGRYVKPVVRSISNGQKTPHPTSYILNRAFAIGLRDGSNACGVNFNQCEDEVEEISRFGTKLFSSPSANEITK